MNETKPKRTTTRTHKRQTYTYHPRKWTCIEPLGKDCGNCGGTGKRPHDRLRHGYHNLTKEQWGIYDDGGCISCLGLGKIDVWGYVTDGDDEERSRSVCGNTVYAAEPKLSDNWDDVDCPSCRHIVWVNSDASKSRNARKVEGLGVVAVFIEVQQCWKGPPHPAHRWGKCDNSGDFDGEYWCNG